MLMTHKSLIKSLLALIFWLLLITVSLTSCGTRQRNDPAYKTLSELRADIALLEDEIASCSRDKEFLMELLKKAHNGAD